MENRLYLYAKSKKGGGRGRGGCMDAILGFQSLMRFYRKQNEQLADCLSQDGV